MGSGEGKYYIGGTREAVHAPYDQQVDEWEVTQTVAVETKEVVLVNSPNSRRASRLAGAESVLRAEGFEVTRELTVDTVAALREIVAAASQPPPLVVAAGGDGTVGAVANYVAETAAVLGILPLGTSNDFARSLGIPMRVDRAARLLREGKVATVDLGRLIVPGEPPRHFVHAATAGLNVSFAKLATRASFRKRLGRLTYAVAAAGALRDHKPFMCRLTYGSDSEQLELTHLSVINAPVYGGFLGLRVRGSSPDDSRLDVLCAEELPARRVVIAALYQLLRISRPVRGVHARHVTSLKVHTDLPLEVALDGEVLGRLPADFVVAAEALRVVTPLEFEDT